MSSWGSRRLSAAAQAPQKAVSIEGVTEWRLPNGLKILTIPDPGVDTITVHIVYLVGSRHEGYGEKGMAHLLEHLLFKGSKRHPNLKEEFTRRGARWNGTTSNDRTNYFETFAATESNLDWALGMEADRMVNSFVRKEDLDSEMTVVRNEFEMGENNPGGVLFQRMQQLAYPWHNYGNPIIGQRADIEKVPIDKLQAFYRTWYQPDNAVLIIAGRFDEARAVALAGKHFGPLRKPTRVLPRLLYRGADAGRRAPRAPGARRRQPDRLHALSRARGQPSRLSRRSTCSPTSWATCPPAGCIAPSCRKGSPRRSGARSAACTIRATCTSAPTSGATAS